MTLFKVTQMPVLRRTPRGPILSGVAVCLAFFGGLAGWSMFAPLASSAIGPGIVSPDGSRRTVQHFEGGIVEKLLVQEIGRASGMERVCQYVSISVGAVTFTKKHIDKLSHDEKNNMKTKYTLTTQYKKPKQQP